MIYYTSDCHFGHSNVIKYNNRPCSTVDEMTELLIKKWNNKVNSDDLVYILGDFCWNYNSKQIKELMDKLNGKKILIIGNHDRISHYYNSQAFIDILPYTEIRDENHRIALSHTPQFEWVGFFDNVYHFYGHTHGKLNLAQYTMLRDRPNGLCWDVGVDNNDYEPVSFKEIDEKIKNNIAKIQNMK